MEKAKSRWTIKNPITIRDIIGFAICLFTSYFAFIKKWDNSRLQEDKIRSQERIKSLENNDKAKALLIDSMKTNTKVLEGVIEYQSKNPKLIIEKYDKVRNNILALSSDSSIKYLRNRIINYK